MQQANIYLFCNVYLYNKRQKSLKIRAKLVTFMKMYRIVYKHFLTGFQSLKKAKKQVVAWSKERFFDRNTLT